MKILAYLFKLLFQCKPLGRYHYACYKRFFKPFHAFRGLKVKTSYDRQFTLLVDVDEWIQQHIFFFGVYDVAGISFIKQQLKPGDVFLDIGANIGTYSLSASARLSKKHGGRVYAFEPVPRIFEKLKQNIALNGVENIMLNQLAVYSEPSTLELYVSSEENIGMSSIFHHDTESGEVAKVEAIRMDDFIEENQVEKVDLVKIDIEGAELFALKGMTRTIEKFKPVFLIEISASVLGEQSKLGDEVVAFMKTFGYAPYTIEPSGEYVPALVISESITNYAFFPNRV
jgi:FkbM family methyltransferase